MFLHGTFWREIPKKKGQQIFANGPKKDVIEFLQVEFAKATNFTTTNVRTANVTNFMFLRKKRCKGRLYKAAKDGDIEGGVEQSVWDVFLEWKP